VNPDQAAAVEYLTNQQLIEPGGPNGDDPIEGQRWSGAGDDPTCPGSQIDIFSGHHRVVEIGRRVAEGVMEPGTLVEFQTP
jgi:hypothetical protein